MKAKILTPKRKKPLICMISAMDKKTLSIGKKGGGLPWHIPADFKYFKETTMGHPIIMGRRTFEEFPKLLPGRTHIVITRDSKYKAPQEVIATTSMEEAIERVSKIDKEKVFIIGGAQIYKLGLPFADRLYLTLVNANFDSPIKFPKFKMEKYTIVQKEKSSDENFSFEFLILDRK